MASDRARELTEQINAELERSLTEPNLADGREDSSDPGEVDSLVGARIKPQPPLISGSIALPIPSEHDLEDLSFPPLEMHLSAAR